MSRKVRSYYAFRLVLFGLIIGSFLISPQRAQSQTKQQQTKQSSATPALITFLFGDDWNNLALYAIDPDGQNVRKLLDGVIKQADYSVSADGNYVLYYHNSLEVRLADIANKTERTLIKKDSNAGSVLALALSPDAKAFTIGNVVSAGKAVQVNIMRVDVETGTQTPLFSYINHDYGGKDQGVNSIESIHWIPDHIIYTFHRNSQLDTKVSFTNEIHDYSLIDNSDKIIHQFTSKNTQFMVNWFKLSTDVSALIRETNDGGQIEVLTLKGARLQLVREPQRGLEITGYNSEYSWIADGKGLFTIGLGVQYYPTKPKNMPDDIRGRFVLRLYDLKTRKFTDFVALGDSGKITEIGFGLIHDMRWYTITQ